MDSGKGRKRPWESDDSGASSTKRRASPALVQQVYDLPPLPLHAGHDLPDSDKQAQLRLPPLYTSSSGIASTPLPTSSQSSLSSHHIPEFRPRSQSLFSPAQRIVAGQWPETARDTDFTTRALERASSPRPIGGVPCRPPVGTDHAPGTAGDVICCSTGCKGQDCVRARALLHKLAAELLYLNSGVGALLQRDHRSLTESPNPEEVSIEEVLRWALDAVSWTNLNLRDRISHPHPHSPDPNVSQSASMRRGFKYQETTREEQSPPATHYGPPYHSFTTFADPTLPIESSRNKPYNNEVPPIGSSPHPTASSSGSMFMSPRSPMQAPQSIRSAVLPSPSSMQFSGATILPPVSPPAGAATQTSAQSALLQDLQHQISVKTIAHQTLQREYDSLLQKLERQRTKCATLEKKFEVSDVEINSLTDEKEKLQAQVAAMEYQVEELQESRDESRRQLVTNGAQYMRIMEMANRLQAQSADEKKRWDAEKADLQQRIKLLEEAMVTGTSEHLDSEPPPSIILAHTSGTSTSSSAETINVLRTEIGRLRIKTQSLEKALQVMKEEGMTIQDAAKKLLESGSKIQRATQEGALE